MEKQLNFWDRSVTILGGGDFSKIDLDACLANSSILISADGGANKLDRTHYKLDYILGDLDSIKHGEVWEKTGTRLIKIDEQDSTDFEKCLYSVNAASYFCTGFMGQRNDHFLAVCSTLAKYNSKKVVLVGAEDIIFHLPKSFQIKLPQGVRFSLFPMKPVLGMHSSGLKWSISDMKFDPVERVGTSNLTISEKIEIELSDKGMLLILPRAYLSNVIEAFIKI